MPPSLPNECLSDVLAFLDGKSLYKCLFVNRIYCKLSIPIIWRDPFTSFCSRQISLINTLLACLNEDEISSLIPCAINIDNQSSLFEYGKFVREIDHEYCANYIIAWLRESSERNHTDYRDCRIRKLINVIYHMIMRQGSNLQKFAIIQDCRNSIDLPKFSIFTTYKPGITNLRFFGIFFDLTFGDSFQNSIEFLSMVSNFCNSIVDCELEMNFFGSELRMIGSAIALLDFIKLQPLERISICINGLDRGNVKKVIYTLEFRSETLKELSFLELDFQYIDLSFLSKLEYLENLEFYGCSNFTFYEAFSKKKLHLKELKLLYCEKIVTIDFLFSETLLKLSLTNATPEIIKAVKRSCPNICFLEITESDLYLDSIISLICELLSLRILYICAEKVPVRILGDYLTSVECLILSFLVDLQSFEYFTNNCKANLKKLVIFFDNKSLRIDYLICVNNFQRVHNSLKVLGIDVGDWTNEELGIIDSLKNQGIDIVSSNEMTMKF